MTLYTTFGSLVDQLTANSLDGELDAANLCESAASADACGEPFAVVARHQSRGTTLPALHFIKIRISLSVSVERATLSYSVRYLRRALSCITQSKMCRTSGSCLRPDDILGESVLSATSTRLRRAFSAWRAVCVCLEHAFDINEDLCNLCEQQVAKTHSHLTRSKDHWAQKFLCQIVMRNRAK